MAKKNRVSLVAVWFALLHCEPCATLVGHTRCYDRLSRCRRRAPAPRASEGMSDESVEDSADAQRIAEFRAKLVAGGLESVTTFDGEEEAALKTRKTWAQNVDRVEKGRVLLGVQDFFFGDKAKPSIVKAACERVGIFTDALDRVPDDRRDSVLSGLLPVVLVLDHSKVGGTTGVLLGRRSGYIMGDFKLLDSSQFLVQPLWVGGPSAPPPSTQSARTAGSKDDENVTGILAIHPYATVNNAVELTQDGLYCGGDWSSAKDLVERGRANPFRFRLIAQATNWNPGELERELNAGAWRVADVSTELLLKDRQRGAPPLWFDIADELER
ncbi:hypothetical protein CTAYLR_004349 [Chrysophaeum taylorii]|uniref:Uncharacterized protein n=1 Tax=Chrysophaeum taylorii TaxID=2483200 RepID=A0AAD7XQV9_9STRA|nr:hypothetical protein CTAYLR_004349 [Chrysophaeum taylorii]